MTQRDQLREALAAIQQSTRDDEKGEQWTIRNFLNKHGVFNDDISGSRRLVAEACRYVLSTPVEPAGASEPPSECPRCGSPSPVMHPLAGRDDSEIRACSHSWYGAPVSPVEPTPEPPLSKYASNLRELAQVLEDGAANPPAVETVLRWTIQHLRTLAESMELSQPLPALPVEDTPRCEWREDLSGPVKIYRPTCMAPVVTDHTPGGFEFCPYCGKSLVLLPAKET